jgi:acyl-CoA synthetase (AMP-forming)/AMP-acid ligase II
MPSLIYSLLTIRFSEKSFMTHPSIHARSHPDKVAYQMASSGKAISYRELDELSNQGAHLFRLLGLKAGDHIALLMENRLAFMEICWAAQRSGLYYTSISRYLTLDEVAYIVKDCGAKLVITSPKCADQVKGLITDAPGEPLFYILDEPLPGFRAFDKEASVQPTTPIPDEVAGYDMLYSSGTTGRPKGIKRQSESKPIDVPNPFLKVLCADMCGMNADSISGGVNIYPQETEDVLITHPEIADVAVFGVPNEEMGEEVKAVVQPHDMSRAGKALEAELISFCRKHLSPIKCPRSVDFEAELPRTPTGKLVKWHLRDRYWPKTAVRVYP